MLRSGQPLEKLIADGAARLEGDASVLATLASKLVHFEVGFEILPGTGLAKLSEEMEVFEQEPLGDTSGG